MRTAMEEEVDDLAEPHDGADREFTLSTPTLLAIFFALVLVCGLFFGLGYTLGRRSSSETADASAATDQAPPIPPVASSGQPKPSAATTTDLTPPPSAPPSVDSIELQPTEPPVTDQKTTPEIQQPTAIQAKTTTPSTPPPSALPSTPVKATPLQVKVPKSASAAVPSEAPNNAIPAGIMVQIAAVSNPNDAKVLVEALQKRGYTVAIRNQPNDRLLHVQLGPFTNRSDAIAMREKLLADGYNAFLK